MLRIAEARIARGWSQEQLAEAIGTTQQTVHRWESGKVDPQVGRVQEISAALGVTVSYLLGVDPPTADSLTSDEARLLDLYRMCNPTGRSYILQLAETTRDLIGGSR